MTCDDVQESFSVYRNFMPDDTWKMAMDEHMRLCEECREQFQFWEESERLIREFSDEDSFVPSEQSHQLSRNVMDRIFDEQPWMAPVTEKNYSFSKGFRRNLSIMIAACMALFGCSLFILLFGQKNATGGMDVTAMQGLMDTGFASTERMISASGFYAEVPIASISDPLVLKLVPTFPQYYVALSLIGLVMALLTLNWLSRTRN